MKKYVGRCPICGAKTYRMSEFLSCPDIKVDGVIYAALPCPNKHRANEMRKFLRLDPLPEDNNVIIGQGNCIEEEQ
jgi:hypothetical protein